MARPIRKASKIRQSPKLPAATRRRQLLTSARRLFVRKGYRATTTEEIAVNAGLTKGALYFHFASKEDILYELVKLISEEHDTLYARVRGKCLAPADFLRELLQHGHKCSGGKFQEVVDIYVQAMRIPRVKRYLARRLKRVLDCYVDHADPQFGRSRKRRRDLAVMTFALHQGLSVLRIHLPGTINIEEQLRLFEMLFSRERPASNRLGGRRSSRR